MRLLCDIKIDCLNYKLSDLRVEVVFSRNLLY